MWIPVTLFGRLHPGYAAHEICERKQADVRSDIYSVGITFYVALHQFFPDEKIKASMYLDRILLKCSAADPQMRYASIEEVIQALRRKRMMSMANMALLAIVLFALLGIGFLNKWNATMEISYQLKLEHGKYEEAIEMYPQRLQGYEGLYKEGDVDKGDIQEVEGLMRKYGQEDNIKLRYTLGLLCMRMQEQNYYRKAADLLQLPAENKFRYAVPFRHMAVLLSEGMHADTQNEYEDTLYSVFDSLKQDKNQKEILAVLALYQYRQTELSVRGLDQMLAALRKTAMSVQDKKEVRELQYLMAECYFQQGSRFYEMGDFGKMEKSFVEAERYDRSDKNDNTLLRLTLMEITRAEADYRKRKLHLDMAEAYAREMSLKQSETVHGLSIRIAALREGG